MKGTIILGIIASVILLIKFWKVSSWKDFVITILLNISVFLTLFESPFLSVGFYFYGASIVLCLSYNLLRRDYNFKSRLPLIVFFTLLFLNYFASLLHLPHAEIFYLFRITCVLIFVFILIRFSKYKTDIVYIVPNIAAILTTCGECSWFGVSG